MSAHLDMPTCADMCRHVTSLSAPMIPIIWTWSAFQYVSAHVEMPTCADMCRVPTCDITLGTSDTNHLDLTSKLACVSTCGHADMCRHVPTCNITLGISDTNPLDITCMLACVSTLDMPTCADMCRHLLICVDMCQHVPSLSVSLIRTLSTVSACWHVSAHLDMPTCADMCRHVSTCRITLGTSDANQFDLICMLACVSTYGHADVCWHVPTCSITLGTSDTNHLDQIQIQIQKPLLPLIHTMHIES